MTENEKGPVDNQNVWAPGPGPGQGDDFDVNDSMGGRSLDRLNYLLSTLQRGWKITILRQQPSWCRGTLETIEFFGEEDEEPVDVDYLIRTWGGRKLMIKVHDERGRWVGGGGVSLFSYAPRVRGVEITEADTFGRIPGPNATYSAPIQPPSQFPQLDLTKIIELASRQKGGDFASILKLAELLQSRTIPQQAPSPFAGIEQLSMMAGVFKQMREIFADFNGAGDGEGGGMDAVVPELIKGLVSGMNRDRPSRGALQAPKGVFKRQAPQSLQQQAPQNPPPSNPAAIGTEGVDKQNIIQIAGLIRDLAPDDAAGCVLLALESMPTPKKEAAMRAFMTQLQSDGNSPDDDDDEEIEDDEPAESPLPSPVSGRRA